MHDRLLSPYRDNGPQKEGTLMSQRIFRSFKEPKREGLSWAERWKGNDKGLITCWEVGRDLRQKDPELARRAENGELPALGWKGGVEKALKIRQRRARKSERCFI
jgi:hypothetical protein